jgi:hypothetical protein
MPEFRWTLYVLKTNHVLTHFLHLLLWW